MFLAKVVSNSAIRFKICNEITTFVKKFIKDES